MEIIDDLWDGNQLNLIKILLVFVKYLGYPEKLSKNKRTIIEGGKLIFF